MVVMWCLVNGMSSSSAFSVDVDPSATIYDLKEAIKAKKSNDFKDIDADRLTLWRVSIPIINDDENPILLDGVGSGDKKKLGPADELSDVFKEEPPKKTIHILIQCPPSAAGPSTSTRTITHIPTASMYFGHHWGEHNSSSLLDR
ncbi:hypothetical protein B0O80DRAFT_60774 [Mortierella sp. GBAus27b]|nr:hypothetical protein B0O80DRAFT_60774 [Mortierella sp. GBAus27b]